MKAGALLQFPEAQHSGLMWMPALKLEEEEEEEEEEGWLKIWCLLDYVNLFQNLQCQECALVNSQTPHRSCIHQYHKMLPRPSFRYVKPQIQRGMSMGLKHCKTIVGKVSRMMNY
jgi:hypothetical protein